ncbi:integrase [Streptomyces albus]|uniref:integrase n=1 Tax=Streptomyces albus TaxID=1888 RepID=UPI003F1AFB19
MRGVNMDVAERPWDGCGKCLVGVWRLFRMKAATTSPERQWQDVLTAAAPIGGHIIGWADDWEVSGATDPVTRPRLGPWLRDEMGSYDGLVAAAVGRLGRERRRLPEHRLQNA